MKELIENYNGFDIFWEDAPPEGYTMYPYGVKWGTVLVGRYRTLGEVYRIINSYKPADLAYFRERNEALVAHEKVHPEQKDEDERDDRIAALEAENARLRKTLSDICNLADELESHLITRDDGKTESMFTFSTVSCRDTLYEATQKAWVMLGESEGE